MTRRLAVWLFLLIVFVAIIAGASQGAAGGASFEATTLTRNGVSYAGQTVQSGSSNKRIAMIPVTGTLVEGGSAADGSATGSEDIVRMLDAIIDKKRQFAGVMFELDTPGGSVLASEEIVAALERLDEETDLPVVAWMRGTAASAGYYISAPTDHIVASANTFTGSIGVILEYYVLDELAEKVGVSAVTVKSGRLKDIGNPLREATDEELELFQQIIDEAYGSFVDVVADGRDMPKARVRELADGRIYTGRQAHENGLVDSLGLRADAFDAMAKLIDEKGVDGKDLKVVRYSRTYGFLETLAFSAQPGLDTLAAVRTVGGVLRGDAGAINDLAGSTGAGSRARIGNGFAQLQYRAELG